MSNKKEYTFENYMNIGMVVVVVLYILYLILSSFRIIFTVILVLLAIMALFGFFGWLATKIWSVVQRIIDNRKAYREGELIRNLFIS